MIGKKVSFSFAVKISEDCRKSNDLGNQAVLCFIIGASFAKTLPPVVGKRQFEIGKNDTIAFLRKKLNVPDQHKKIFTKIWGASD